MTHNDVISLVDESLKKLGLDYVDIIQVHDVEFAPNLARVILFNFCFFQTAGFWWTWVLLAYKL